MIAKLEGTIHTMGATSNNKSIYFTDPFFALESVVLIQLLSLNGGLLKFSMYHHKIIITNYDKTKKVILPHRKSQL